MIIRRAFVIVLCFIFLITCVVLPRDYSAAQCPGAYVDLLKKMDAINKGVKTFAKAAQSGVQLAGAGLRGIKTAGMVLLLAALLEKGGGFLGPAAFAGIAVTSALSPEIISGTVLIAANLALLEIGFILVANDPPDLNFEEVALPGSYQIYTPVGDTSDEKVLTALINATSEQVVLLEAFLKASERGLGARDASKLEFIAMQINAARQYIPLLIESQKKFSTAVGDFHKLCNQRWQEAKPYLDKLRNRSSGPGLTPQERTLLIEAGITDITIDANVESIARIKDAEVESWLSDVKQLSELAGSGESVFQAQDQLYQEIFAMGLPHVNPLVDFDITGNTKSVGLFNSDPEVSIVVRKPFQNVNSIGYSLDNGATWNAYSQPFTITQEGAVTLLARCVDISGNVSKSRLVIYRDLTAPNITFTKSQNTDNQTLLLIKITDRQPGSGLYRILAKGANLEINDNKLNPDTYSEIFAELPIDKTYEYSLEARQLDKNVEAWCTVTAEDHCGNISESKMDLPLISQAKKAEVSNQKPAENNYIWIIAVVIGLLIFTSIIIIITRKKRSGRQT